MKKLFALFMAILMVVSVMTGCGCKKAINEESSTDAVNTGTVKNPANIVEVGEYGLNIDEFNVHLYTGVQEAQYEVGNAPGWDETLCTDGLTARDSAIEKAVEYSRQSLGMYIKAKELGIYTAEDETAYKEYIIAANGGEEWINSIVEQNNFSRDAFETYIVHVGAYEAVARYEAEKVFAEDAMTAQHVLILFNEGEDESVAYEKAMNVYNLAVSGEDFDLLIEQYNEDPGQTVGGSYTFAEGEMVDEFYQGTKALEIGGISEPVKTTYGYHVIKRCELIGTDSPTYENELMEIMNYNSTVIANCDALLENVTIVTNEDLISQIDMSFYTAAE